jgi:hypothetical protein
LERGEYGSDFRRGHVKSNNHVCPKHEYSIRDRFPIWIHAEYHSLLRPPLKLAIENLAERVNASQIHRPKIFAEAVVNTITGDREISTGGIIRRQILLEDDLDTAQNVTAHRLFACRCVLAAALCKRSLFLNPSKSPP